MARVLVAALRGGYQDVLDEAVIDAQHEDEWERALAAPTAPGTHGAVAVDPTGTVVGFARCGPDPDDPSPELGYIASVYVAPEASGAGIGWRLVRRCVERLAGDGRYEVTLWVFRDNARGRALYERCGFHADGAELTDPRWGAAQLRYRLSGATGPRADDTLLTVVSPTEERNPRTEDIDTIPVLELLQRLNAEDARVPGAVREVLPRLAGLVQAAVVSLASGGRVHYFGAGSSGRQALLDAAEMPPTFGVAPELFVAHLAGGDAAVRRAREGAEDDAADGAREADSIDAGDVVIGLASSGYTAYVGGALENARRRGAHTALVTSNPQAPLAGLVDVVLCVQTGPEAITGSTRLKSATAQKLVLNAFSTAVMVRTGRTWSNLMVDLVPSNAKLRGRVVRLLTQASGEDEATCERALAACDQETKTALVSLLSGAAPEAARAALAAHGGRVALALRAVTGG
jgi:N-acetylmuramic acid 6-phosphate etherase